MYGYLVQGTTGEYSDRTDWPVKIFLSEVRAIAFQQDLTDSVASYVRLRDDNGIHYFQHPDKCEDPILKSGLLQKYHKILSLDPKYQEDYTGTSYWITKVPIEV